MLSKTYLLLLYATNWVAFADNNYDVNKNGQELLLCRQCGADIADSYYIVSKNSPGAQKTEKLNLFGRQNITVQTLINPFGVKYEIVTAKKARCENVGPSLGADSWFPGYMWRICTCPQCGQHLGWTFKNSSIKLNSSDNETDIDSFHGLILTNILGENYSETAGPIMMKFSSSK